MPSSAVMRRVTVCAVMRTVSAGFENPAIHPREYCKCLLPAIASCTLKRVLHSPWLVASVVLVIAALPVIAALSAYREQAQRAEALLFERSAEIAVGQFRLVTARQMGWLNTLRTQVSNRPEAPEKLLNEMLTAGAWINLPENCRLLAYGAVEGGQVTLRWQRVKSGPPLGTDGSVLLTSSEAAQLLWVAMEKPRHVHSAQSGGDLLTIMTVNESSSRRLTRGWMIAAWDLEAMCADPQLRLVVTDHTLTARPFEEPLMPTERVFEIGEGDARWSVALGKGAGFNALFPRVSESAITLTGGGCALLLAMLAGFATRAAGLRAALASEREMVRMKDHLLHSVSHEFRTPLSVILSSADLLDSYAERLAPERRTEAFTQIRDSTSRMNDMIEQVLLLSRIEARRLPVEPRNLDVAALARELAREIETATHARCPVNVTVPDTLDATLDATLLRAVLSNLLSNAVKFSPSAEPVEFTVYHDVLLCFTIRDHGPGIAAEDLPHVREPYFRAPSADEVPGNGLGLTIADKCAGLLGGTLTIMSGTKGTTATLTI
jgi:signal transduction histidine kinase